MNFAGTRGPVLLLLAALSALGAVGCSRDMEEQVSFQPQETPRKHSPPESIPMLSRSITLPPTQTEARLRQGAQLFTINCVHCHGPDGDGDGPVAGYLKEMPANLRAPHVQKKSEREIYEILTNGSKMCSRPARP